MTKTKAIQLPAHLVDRLEVAADDRILGRNRLAELLLERALDALIPVDELLLRRTDEPSDA